MRKAAERDQVPSDRVPILIQGMTKPLSLKPSCIWLPPQKRPYRTLDDFRAEHNSIFGSAEAKAKRVEDEQIGALTETEEAEQRCKER